MHAEDVVVDHRGQGQAVEHRVAPFPHLLAELVSEPVLSRTETEKKMVGDFVSS